MSSNEPQLQKLKTVRNPQTDAHINGEYFKKNPTWHVEYSPLKAQIIYEVLRSRQIRPKTIGDVGCGAGEVLSLLQKNMDPATCFWGYDVAAPAIDMAKTRENERLKFALADFPETETPHFDLLLALEVIDHVEDYIGFARALKNRAEWKFFSFSLDISVQSAFRSDAFLKKRRNHSHLHHFNKQTALATLEYAGYEIVEYFYRQPNVTISTTARLARPIRKAFFGMAPELAVRIFGGYSLQVLAR
ncbi:MAG TPA: class I SAM-dependent methyltransferase [Nitrospiraceae bacterium]|nr:class I SAM-dependent methyltransferase [Nitrospiraceae bacterium]